MNGMLIPKLATGQGNGITMTGSDSFTPGRGDEVACPEAQGSTDKRGGVLGEHIY